MKCHHLNTRHATFNLRCVSSEAAIKLGNQCKLNLAQDSEAATGDIVKKNGVLKNIIKFAGKKLFHRKDFLTLKWCAEFVQRESVLKVLQKFYDEAFCKNSYRLKAVNCC